MSIKNDKNKTDCQIIWIDFDPLSLFVTNPRIYEICQHSNQ